MAVIRLSVQEDDTSQVRALVNPHDVRTIREEQV